MKPTKAFYFTAPYVGMHGPILSHGITWFLARAALSVKLGIEPSELLPDERKHYKP